MKHTFNAAYVADYLRTYRRYKSLTLNELSTLTGLSVSTLHSLEWSDRATYLESLYVVATHYGILMSTLFEFSETAQSVGLEKAYELEAPHLVSYRRFRNPNLKNRHAKP